MCREWTADSFRRREADVDRGFIRCRAINGPSLHSLADDLYENPFRSAAVELAIKDLLPRSEVEAALGDGDNDLAAHDLALVVGVAVVFARAVVVIGLGRGIVGSKLFEPAFVIFVQAVFVVVDEYRCSNVHRVDQHQAFANTAAFDGLSNARGDIDEVHSRRNVQRNRFAKAFHKILPANATRSRVYACQPISCGQSTRHYPQMLVSDSRGFMKRAPALGG